jgi:urease accessory protein
MEWRLECDLLILPPHAHPLLPTPGGPPADAMAVILIHGPAAGSDPSRPEIPVRADRRRLARRLWRGAADDGTEFGFELDRPLRHGELVWMTAAARYVVRQDPEPVLELALPASPAEAAMTGWAVGNLHFEVDADGDRLLAPDDPALRQALDRLGIPYRAAEAVFEPHRFAADGHGHGHHHPHDHDHSHGHSHAAGD